MSHNPGFDAFARANEHLNDPEPQPPKRRAGRWVLYLFGLILQVALLGFGGVLFYTGIHTDDWVSFVAGVAALTSFLLAHEYDWRGGDA